MINKKNTGFTIVELLVVIAVIGILASIGIVSYASYQNRAKKSALTATAEQVKAKLGEYYTDNYRYPQLKTDVVTYLNSSSQANLATDFQNSAFTFSAKTSTDAVCSTTSSPKCDKYTITIDKSGWNGSSSETNYTTSSN